MVIALCLPFPIDLRGGVSVLVETLLVNFVQAGHEIILVSTDAAGIPLNSTVRPLVKHHIYWDGSDSMADARRLAQLIAAAGAQVVHFHFGIYGFGNRFPFHCPTYFLDRMGVPCVTTAHMAINMLDGYCDEKKPTWFKLLIWPLVWSGKLHQLLHVRAEIAVSDQNLAKFRRWFWPLKARYRRIYHSRLSNELPPEPTAPRQKIILNVGHIARRKGQGVLAEAFVRIARRYPEWVLQLVGHDDDKITFQKIKKLAQENQLEDRLQLLGARNDAQELMRHAAIYVQPAFWEGLPLALQEAMFNGCPAIGTDADGIAELIEPGKSGLIVPAGEVAQLADALEMMIKDEPMRRQMGVAAAQAIREKGMMVSPMVEKHLDLYAGLIKTKQN